jgi:hypothetical protein
MEGHQGSEGKAALCHRHDGLPFGVAGLWENWKSPAGEWVRTFAIITTDANELVGQIHDRMPIILHRADYDRWLSGEPDPRDLLWPFESDAMRVWPISTRVNKPENDDRPSWMKSQFNCGKQSDPPRQVTPRYAQPPTGVTCMPDLTSGEPRSDMDIFETFLCRDTDEVREKALERRLIHPSR